jgi:hypothetical protein
MTIMLKTPVCRAFNVLGGQQHTTTPHVIPENTHPEEESCANSKIAFSNDEIQLRKMISRIFAMTGVSESWLTAM